VFGFVNPVTCDTTIRLWSLKVWVALMPVWPVVDAMIMFFMLSCSARFFASCSVWSVFLGPDSLKYTVLVSVLVMFGFLRVLFVVFVCYICCWFLFSGCCIRFINSSGVLI
jgi:hypothetical protein